MASERQFEANRKNAKRSTGPKTRAGKARSSRNALRHGLARTTIANEVAPGGLIAALISSVNHSMQLEDAESLVRAKGILSRIRIIRHEVLIALLECHTPGSLRTLKSLERYERAALAKQKRVLRSAKILRRSADDASAAFEHCRHESGAPRRSRSNFRSFVNPDR
jgi:hypothetical protein